MVSRPLSLRASMTSWKPSMVFAAAAPGPLLAVATAGRVSVVTAMRVSPLSELFDALRIAENHHSFSGFAPRLTVVNYPKTHSSQWPAIAEHAERNVTRLQL